MSGTKHDGGKPAMHLVAPVALRLEAQVMSFGEKKYGSYNYLEGMAWSRLVAAAMRHLQAWHEGENLDPETGITHLAHCRCCLGMLMTYEAYGLGEDDRFGTKLRTVKGAEDSVEADQEDEGDSGPK